MKRPTRANYTKKNIGRLYLFSLLIRSAPYSLCLERLHTSIVTHSAKMALYQ